MADNFCKLFDAITAKYTLKPTGKRKYHRSSTMSKAEVMLIMILFHTSGYRCFIETMNDKLKNIAQVEHSRHRCFDNFIVNLLGTIATYCLFPKKPCINYKGPLTHSLHCSEFGELTLFSTVRIRINYQFYATKERYTTDNGRQGRHRLKR